MTCDRVYSAQYEAPRWSLVGNNFLSMDDLVENSKVLSIGLDELLDQGNSTPRPTKKGTP